MWGSGRRPYAKWRMLDPTITGARDSGRIFTGDCYAIRVATDNAAVGDEVQILGESKQGFNFFGPSYDIGAFIDEDVAVFLTEIPEYLFIRKVQGTANVSCIVDVYYGPTQR